MPGARSLEQVYVALRDVTFPASKDDLIKAATAAAAPEEVLKALRAIPPEEYGSQDEVGRSVRIDPAGDLSAGQRGEQARLGGSPGLGQHERDVPLTPVEQADREIP